MTVFHYDAGSTKIDFFSLKYFASIIGYNIAVNLLFVTIFLVTFITILKWTPLNYKIEKYS